MQVRARKKAIFLEAYERYGTIGAGIKAAKIRRERVADWAAADPVFAKRFEQAKLTVGDMLETEVIRRAVEGEEKIIRDKNGKEVDTVYEKSDDLLKFATRRYKPEYREKFELPLIPGGNTTNIQNNIIVKLDPTKLAPEQLEIYEQLLSTAAADPNDPSGGATAALPGPQGTPPAPIPPVR